MTTSGEERMGVSEARANLTEVIAKVRLLGQRVVLTRRDKPQAALVSHEFYEQALRDRSVIVLLRERAEAAADNEHEMVRDHARFVMDWLADIEASLNF